MGFNEDQYWENRREEYEGSNRKAVAKCYACDCDLYAGDPCYWVEWECYCEDCVQYDTIEESEPDYD